MRTFYENVEQLVADHPRFGSRQKLSEHLNPDNPKYLATAQKKGQEISLSKAAEIADALGVSLSDLVRPGAVATNTPDIAQIMLAHERCSGKISEFGHLLEMTDLYHPPKPNDSKLNIFRVGKNSFAAKTLQNLGPEVVQEAINSSGNEKLDRTLVASYEAALGGLPILSRERLDERVSVAPYRITLKYLRLLLKVHDDQGRVFIMNYCKELPSSKISSASRRKSSREL